jgi:hypothetical protein
MIDPKETLGAVRARTQKAKKTGGRLLVSGLGFAAAYFLDPDHGHARRMRARESFDLLLLRRRADSARGTGGEPTRVPESTADVVTLERRSVQR